ncbi:hypothetical protein ACFQU7_40860 [Pseudoroseomonas wenyumeiae]
MAADWVISAAAAVRTEAQPSAAQQRQETGRARRQARYEEAARMHAAGASISDMSRQLNADRKTLRRWLQAGGLKLAQDTAGQHPGSPPYHSGAALGRGVPQRRSVMAGTGQRRVSRPSLDSAGLGHRTAQA